MLVGAGGNAGNQSAVSVIRDLATGAIDLRSGARSVLALSDLALPWQLTVEEGQHLEDRRFGRDTHRS